MLHPKCLKRKWDRVYSQWLRIRISWNNARGKDWKSKRTNRMVIRTRQTDAMTVGLRWVFVLPASAPIRSPAAYSFLASCIFLRQGYVKGVVGVCDCVENGCEDVVYIVFRETCKLRNGVVIELENGNTAAVLVSRN
ncbi:hypothetical protein Hdeb2414_s0008g00269961 [Helianthus debilis subsp. tardiflorus]